MEEFFRRFGTPPGFGGEDENTRPYQPRRGVSQVCLSLWAATLAACVGILYTGAREVLFGPRPLTTDPFVWGCLAVGADHAGALP